MSSQQPTTENVTVTNQLATVPDSRRAADLFARILQAVREQRAKDECQKQDRGNNAT
jgi:hypothetical protein